MRGIRTQVRWLLHSVLCWPENSWNLSSCELHMKHIDHLEYIQKKNWEHLIMTTNSWRHWEYSAKQSIQTQEGYCHFIQLSEGTMHKRFVFVPCGPKKRSWSQWIETQGGLFQPQTVTSNRWPKDKTGWLCRRWVLSHSGCSSTVQMTTWWECCRRKSSSDG